VLINGWVALAALVHVAVIVSLFVGAPTLWAGWTKVQKMYSPFNVPNFLVELSLFSPAFGAI
jgi:hypothetical protein